MRSPGLGSAHNRTNNKGTPVMRAHVLCIGRRNTAATATQQRRSLHKGDTVIREVSRRQCPASRRKGIKAVDNLQRILGTQ